VTSTAIDIFHTNSVYRVHVLSVAHAKMATWIPTPLGTEVAWSQPMLQCVLCPHKLSRQTAVRSVQLCLHSVPAPQT